MKPESQRPSMSLFVRGLLGPELQMSSAILSLGVCHRGDPRTKCAAQVDTPLPLSPVCHPLAACPWAALTGCARLLAGCGSQSTWV